MNRRGFLKVSLGAMAASVLSLLSRNKFTQDRITNVKMHNHAMADKDVGYWVTTKDWGKENEVSGDRVGWLLSDGKWHYLYQEYDETGYLVKEWIDGIRQRIM